MPSQHKENAFISPSGFYKESLCSSVLSSTTAITDANGSLTQHVLYFAYGEQFVDEHRNSTNSPYLFNGKEYDEETGRYYYGARYYDPRVSLWIGVDPLAGKYPSMSPFVYCANNPIRFLDPDGNEIVDANGKKITYSKEKGWSSNATEDVKIIHQSLMQTETGTEQWNKAYSSDRKMFFKISDETKKENGITRREFSQNMESREVYLDKGKVQEIFIYKGTLENDGDYRYKGLSLREKVGVVAGHEIEHATNEQNIKEEALNIKFGGNIYDIEKIPNEIGKKIVKESKSQIINKMEAKPAFITRERNL